MCKSNVQHQFRQDVAGEVNKKIELINKLAMRIDQYRYLTIMVIFVQLITISHTIPNKITIVNDQINLTKAEYNYIFNQVKDQLLVNIRHLVHDDLQIPSAKYYELCNMSFIDSKEAQQAYNEYLDIDIWLNGNNSLENEEYRRHRINRRSINPSQFNKFINKYNQNIIPTIDQPESNEKQRTIATAVFIDRFLAAKFQNRMSDLKKLVFTIMYQVLSSATQSPNTADGDIDKYLDNFCAWQSRLRKWPQEQWDHALMLTGLDLYKDLGNGKKNKKVLGLAWVNGMCKSSYSCTLNEGKSFEASYVIAHEMGHSLGILHDGRGNNCDGDKYLMSEKTGLGKVNWSPCSNFYIENFISRGHAKCLEDNAVVSPELDFKTNVLPGRLYNANLQCQLALGLQYTAYFSSKSPFNDICRELWCITNNWATPAHPALEGTQCSNTGQCFQGQCKTITMLDQIPAQPSVRSSNSIQSNLISVQRNYIPTINSSKQHHENLSTDNRSSKSRLKLMNGQMNGQVNGQINESKRIITNTSVTTIIKPLTTVNRVDKKSETDYRSSSLMEDIRGFFKTMTSNAEGFFSAFKFKLG